MKNSKLLVGWGRCDITPERPVHLTGQFYTRLSTHVRDPLTATACAIEGDGGEVIMVSCDLAGVSGELIAGVRDAVAKAAPQIDPDSIIMSAIHTHTGPACRPRSDGKNNGKTGHLSVGTLKLDEKDDVVSPEEYYDFVVPRLCGIIVEAYNSKKPCGIASELEYCTVGFNRIMLYKDGSARMYGNAETADFEGVLGAADPGVEMLFVFGEGGKLSGIIIEVACPSQVVEHHYFVSADYWGETRKLLREQFGDIEVLPICGPAGDQSPRDMVRMKRESNLRSGESPLNSHMPKADITKPGWEMYDERGLLVIAKRLRAAVLNAYERAKDHIGGSAVVRHVRKDLLLPMLRVSLEEYLASYQQCVAILKKNGLDPEGDWSGESVPSTVKEEIYIPFGIVRRYEAQQASDIFPVETHVFRIGDIAFYSVPFELFLEYAFRIRARVRYDHVVGIQLACGSEGYLPTKRAVEGKSYSAIAASNTIGPDGGTLLAAILGDTLNSLL